MKNQTSIQLKPGDKILGCTYQGNKTRDFIVDLVDLGIVSREFTSLYVGDKSITATSAPGSIIAPNVNIKWTTTAERNGLGFMGRSAAGQLTISDPSEELKPEKETYISPFSGRVM